MKFLRDLWNNATLLDKFILVLAPLYLFSPVDFLPEILLGPLGLTDDAAAVIAFITTIARIRNRFTTTYPKTETLPEKRG